MSEIKKVKIIVTFITPNGQTNIFYICPNN